MLVGSRGKKRYIQFGKSAFELIGDLGVEMISGIDMLEHSGVGA